MMPAIVITPDEFNQLRLILALGFTGVGTLLLWELMSGLERRSRPGLSVKDLPKPGEECKLHSRKLTECTRQGMHSPASDETDTEEGTDDSAG